MFTVLSILFLIQHPSYDDSDNFSVLYSLILSTKINIGDGFEESQPYDAVFTKIY